MDGTTRNSTVRAVRARPRSAVTAVLIVAMVGVLAPATPAQEVVDPDPLVVAFDDPTVLARAIDERIARALASCMAEAGFEYVVADDARFDLGETDTVREVAPDLDLAVRDLVPRVVARDRLESALIDREVDVEVADAPRVTPERVDGRLRTAPRLEELPALVDPERTDRGLRVRPREEGYGVSVDPFDIGRRDPNLDIVRDLTPGERKAYERALYGRPVAEIDGADDVAGCAARIQTILEDEIYPALQTLDSDLATLERQIESDDRYTDALGRWSECMEDTDVARNLDLRTPDDAVELANERFEALGRNDEAALAAARAFEKQLAEADYRCRATTTDPAIAAVLLTDGGRLAARTLDTVVAIVEGEG